MLWEEVVRRAATEGVPPEFVLREEAQKGILSYLSREGFFQGGVFQGGTSLRLFHGNVRYSEDMDFVFVQKGHPSFTGFIPTLSGLPVFLLDVFPFAAGATLKVQKDTDSHKRAVARLEVPQAGGALAVRIEAVNVPAYEHGIFLLPFPPFNPPVRVEGGEEILADKVVAVAFREFLKGRDLWDIFFLAAQKGVPLRPDLVAKKVLDYGYTREEFDERAARAVERIAREGAAALDQEMSRFMPESALSLWRTRFAEAVERVSGIVGGMRAAGSGR